MYHFEFIVLEFLSRGPTGSHKSHRFLLEKGSSRAPVYFYGYHPSQMRRRLISIRPFLNTSISSTSASHSNLRSLDHGVTMIFAMFSFVVVFCVCIFDFFPSSEIYFVLSVSSAVVMIRDTNDK